MTSEQLGLNLEEVFSGTPGKRNRIHFNNAGMGLTPQCVLDVQIEYLKLEASIGGYEAAEERNEELERVYDSAAKLINCAREEVAIVENASVGWAMAFYAIPFSKGDRILTVEAEYASNYLAYLHIEKEKGVSVEIVPSNEQGNVCLNSMKSMIDSYVKLISITHIPTNCGTVNDVAAIGEIARENDILYLVDACQSVGQLPIDVDRIKCDFLSATSRKYLRGPRGVGFLYVRKSCMDRYQLHPPMIDLHGAQLQSLSGYKLREDARRFENWESNCAAKLGFGAAVDYALLVGVEGIAYRIDQLASSLREKLRQIDQVLLHAVSDNQCGIVSFYVKDMASRDIMTLLRTKGINVSVSRPTSTLIDATKHGLPDLIRASVHYYNDEQEVEQFVQAINALVVEG